MLSNMERAFWLLDRGHPFNGVQVVSLRGPLTRDLLLAGLRRVEAQHPAMRVRVVPVVAGDERRLLLTDEGAAPIPLRIVPRKSEHTWQEVVTEELNQRFATSSDYLTRAIWVRGETESELIFAQHHVTCDALSINYAVRDLLNEMHALLRGESKIEVQSLLLRPSLPSLLPQKARGWRRLFYMLAFFYKHVLKRPLRRARKLPIEQFAPPEARRSRLVHRELAATETRELAEVARREGTTVHAALCAAMLLSAGEVAFALAENSPSRRRVTMGCATAVSLRRELSPPVHEEMGLYVSQVTTFHRITDEQGAPLSLWQLARQIKAQLSRTMENGEQYLTLPLIGLFIPRGKNPGPRFIRRFDGGSPAALAVTNIGPLPIPLIYGPFVIKNCHFAVNPSVVSPLIVTASSLGEVLNLNLIHVEPLCSAARATAILDGALRRLRGVFRTTSAQPRAAS